MKLEGCLVAGSGSAWSELPDMAPAGNARSRLKAGVFGPNRLSRRVFPAVSFAADEHSTWSRVNNGKWRRLYRG